MSVFPWTSKLWLCTGHKNMQSVSMFVDGTFYIARGVKNVIWLMAVGNQPDYIWLQKTLREQWETFASGKGQFSLCAHVCFKYSNRLWSAVKICQIWLHFYWEAKWQNQFISQKTPGNPETIFILLLIKLRLTGITTQSLLIATCRYPICWSFENVKAWSGIIWQHEISRNLHYE